MGKPRQGKFIPKNKDKYEGNYNNIFYRSGLELKAMTYLDTHTNVISWHSEETVIPYVSPLDNQWHRYFVDLKATVKQSNGAIVTFLIEVKPSSQCVAPTKKRGRKQNLFESQVATYAVNQRKWDAAKNACEKLGWKFSVWTEKEIKNFA